MDFTKICFGGMRWVGLAQDYIRWQTLVLAVLKLRFLLPECAFVILSTCSEGSSSWKIGQCTDQLRRLENVQSRILVLRFSGSEGVCFVNES
jgi:hypothetical protein